MEAGSFLSEALDCYELWALCIEAGLEIFGHKLLLVARLVRDGIQSDNDGAAGGSEAEASVERCSEYAGQTMEEKRAHFP
eukprot:3159818-Rhodomonas_salina.1